MKLETRFPVVRVSSATLYGSVVTNAIAFTLWAPLGPLRTYGVTQVLAFGVPPVPSRVGAPAVARRV